MKTLAYAAIAAIIGASMVLLPTWLFLSEAASSSFGYAERLSSGAIPLLARDEGETEPAAPQWLGVTGAALAVALGIYVLVKRKVLISRAQDSLR